MDEKKTRTVFISGASSGLGNAIASYLSKKGMRVYGTSRNPSKYNFKADEFFDLLPMDAGNEKSVNTAVETVLEKEGRIDLLVCNAGMGIAGSVEDSSLKDIEQQMNVNFLGVVRLVKAVLPVMRDRPLKIIIIGSLAGRTGIPFQAFYSASKFALEGFVEALRLELRPFPAQVCIIEPGDFRTGFTGARKTVNSENSPYSYWADVAISQMEKDEQSGAWPIEIARLVYKLESKKRLRTRYSVGMMYQRIFLQLKRVMPDRLFEFGFAVIYGLLKRM